MTSICFILPYFGKFPNYFDQYLESCAQNPTINWLIFTDDKTPHCYPENVTVHTLSFEEFCTYFVQKLAKKPLSPYKLCDYKATYGYVLQEFITAYDFWGFCDCDLIFGDIRKFVTEDILLQYDKIFTRGHCTLLRNVPNTNLLFQKVISLGKYTFDEVCNIPTACASDEWGGLSRYCKQHDIAQYDEMVFDDIQYNNLRIFRTTREIDYTGAPLTSEKLQFKKDKHLAYQYQGGQLHRVFLRERTVCREEVMYVHFQKRRFQESNDNPNNNYFIAPNYFAALSTDTFSTKNLIAITRYDTFLFVAANNAKNKVLNIRNRIRGKLKRLLAK